MSYGQTHGKETVTVTSRSGTLYWLPIVLVCGQLLLYLIYRDGYLWSVAEDGAYEWATFAAYALAAVAAGLLTWRWLRQGLRWRAASYLVLTLGFIFIAGEEISWGQRVFDFAGPEALVERNLQDEANLHNLLGKFALHGAYVMVGLWGVGVGRVVARRVSWLKPVHVFAPGPELFWWFLPVLAFYVYVGTVGVGLGRVIPDLEVLSSGPPRFQEPTEFLLGVGFLLFVLSVRQRALDGRGVDG